MSRVFKITKVRDNNGYDYTIFLHDSLQFRDSVILNRITFANKPPFNTYREGDIIDIHTDVLTKYSANSILDDTSILNMTWKE